MPSRDFRGYDGRPPDVQWPGNAKVAVSLVVNFEEGAEFAVSEGDDHNEAIYEVIDRVEGRADPCIDSHFEYGTRAGYWRIMEAIEAFEGRATVSACGMAAARCPWLVADAASRGHEIAAHGWRWESHAELNEDEERASICKTVSVIEAAAGRRPVGWHTRSAASNATRRLLVEHGGFLYDSDAYNDDVPYFTEVSGKKHLVLPYSFDTNDMHFQHTNRFARGDDFAGYVTDAFDCLWREGAHAPRMLSIGLHLRMIGRPGRIIGLQKVLAHIIQKGGGWIATREQIARHWWDACGSTKAGG